MNFRSHSLFSRRLSSLIFLLGMTACLAGLTPALHAQTAHFSRAIRIPGGAAAEANRNALAAKIGVGALPEDIQTTHGDFGPVNVGTSSATPVAMVFTFDASVTLGSTAVVTQGAPNLDFTDAGGGTCQANTAYNAGNTCTVNVTFKPKYPGPRYGAAELLDASGNLLANGYVQGTGEGPLAVFSNTTSGAYLPSQQIKLGSGFTYNMGVAVDGSGNVFVSGDDGVHEVVAAGGYTSVNTLGSGFFRPYGLAVDGSGNVFVAEPSINAVKEIVAAGGYTAIKILGSGFIAPNSVAVDGSGNLFVADTGNSSVKEIVAAGGYATVNTLNSGFTTPWAVAVDGSGNVFVADRARSTVKEIVAAGGYTTVNTVGAGFSVPEGVAVDGSGNLFVADSGNHAVMEVVAAGGYTTVHILGSGFSWPSWPRGVAVDGSGNVFVADNDQGLYKLDFADPPSPDFGPAPVGFHSIAQSVTISNNGNAALKFPIPASGDNPIISGSFTLDSATTCPLLSTSSTAGQLPKGTSCVYLVDFIPVSEGTNSGSLKVTDNSLNAGPGATQTISMTGEGVAPPTHLKFTPPPSANLEAGGTSVTVKASAANSQGVVTSFSGLVTLTVTGPNSYSSVYSAAASSGVATFNDIAALSVPGSYTYTATDTPEGLTQAVAQETVWPAQRSYAAPATSVGSASAMQTATLRFETSGTLSTIDALTQGAANLDFQLASGGTCAIGTVYTAEQTCTVNYIFDPLYPGQRLGAIRLTDSSMNVLATGHISGTGVGPLVTFANPVFGVYRPSKQSILARDFTNPRGVAVDASGNVFFAYNVGYNHKVMEIVAAGGYTTLKTLGSGFSYPFGVAVDGSGNVIVADSGIGSVKEILAAGGYTTVKTLSHGFSYPFGVAVDASGNVFVADTANNAVKEIVAAGGYTTVKNIASGFNHPDGVAVDGSGNVFVADSLNNAVKEIVAAGGYTTVKILSSGFYPISIAVDASGNVFVTDLGQSAVKEIVAEGGYTTVKKLAGFYFQGAGGLSGGVAVDESGKVFVTDSGEVVMLDYADPPSLSFNPIRVGWQGNELLTVSNNGNAVLTFPIPAAGHNPSISSGFTLDSATTCPQVGTSSTAGKLAKGTSCVYAVNFKAVALGAISGSLTLTDNNLNAAGPGYAMESIGLSATAPNSPFGAIGAAVDSVTGSTTVSQSHSLKVQGWVADPQDGAPLGNVKVYVDGVSIGTPTLGLPRPNVAATYGSQYLNSGFLLLYPASSFSLGTHKVTVVAVDSGGRSTTIGPHIITVQ